MLSYFSLRILTPVPLLFFCLGSCKDHDLPTSQTLISNQFYFSTQSFAFLDSNGYAKFDVDKQTIDTFRMPPTHRFGFEITPDGSHFLCVGLEGVTVVSTETQTIAGHIPAPVRRGIAISPNSRYLLTCDTVCDLYSFPDLQRLVRFRLSGRDPSFGENGESAYFVSGTRVYAIDLRHNFTIDTLIFEGPVGSFRELGDGSYWGYDISWGAFLHEFFVLEKRSMDTVYSRFFTPGYVYFDYSSRHKLCFVANTGKPGWGAGPPEFYVLDFTGGFSERTFSTEGLRDTATPNVGPIMSIIGFCLSQDQSTVLVTGGSLGRDFLVYDLPGVDNPRYYALPPYVGITDVVAGRLTNLNGNKRRFCRDSE